MVLFSELAGAPADCIWPGSQGAKNVDRKDGDSGWITVINGLWMDYGFMDCGWISPKSENEFWRMLVQSIRSHAWLLKQYWIAPWIGNKTMASYFSSNLLHNYMIQYETIGHLHIILRLCAHLEHAMRLFGTTNDCGITVMIQLLK